MHFVYCHIGIRFYPYCLISLSNLYSWIQGLYPILGKQIIKPVSLHQGSYTDILFMLISLFLQHFCPLNLPKSNAITQLCDFLSVDKLPKNWISQGFLLFCNCSKYVEHLVYYTFQLIIFQPLTSILPSQCVSVHRFYVILV